MKRCKILLVALIALTLIGQSAFATRKTVQPVNPKNVEQMVRDMNEGINPYLPGVMGNKGGYVNTPAIPAPAGQNNGNMANMIDQFPRQLRGQQEVMRTDNFLNAGNISMGDAWRNPLDLPTCTLSYGAVDTFSYFPGMLAGDGYKVWVDPALCPGCAPVYPFRVDSMCFQIVQDDGSPVDTIFIGVDVECAFGDPLDPCGGPGAERCFSIFSIALPLDTLDTFLSVYNVWLPFDSCWVDGPFFAGLFFLGNTVTDTAFSKPTFRLDGGDTPVVPVCEAWANISGTWQSWADTWVDPDPGYPILTVAGECNDPNADVITPCPNLCTQSRINSAIAFFDPTTTAVWQWYAESQPSTLSFPYDPEQIDFSLYWYAAGTLQDSVEITIFYGCPRFGDNCCAPMDVLCAGSIYITRTSAGANNLVPVSLDLSSFACCLPEDFWVGAAITDAQAGDTLPSFLYSNINAEVPTPPNCDQWMFSNGNYIHLPSGNLGWWDALLAGVCGDCGIQDPDTCPAPPSETLDCAGAVVVACNPNGVVLTGQTTIGGSDNVTEYCCTPWFEDGPERVYQITVGNGANISADVSATTADLDVFILSACNPAACVAAGDSIANATSLTAGTYYIVVDGFNAAQGNYTLTVVCTQNCPTLGVCLTEFQVGPINTLDRYLDGEWDASTPNTMYWMYYPGSLNRQKIVRMNVNTCTYDTIGWTSVDASTCRGLAFDPRNSGQYWTATITNFTAGTGRLYRVSNTGVVQNTFTSIAGMHAMRFSGLAFDPDNNHLWCLIRGGQAVATGLDTAYCIDVTNAAAPVLVQGPHALQPLYQTPYAPVSCGGVDYAPATNKLIFAAQGTPNDVVECFTDINPAYAGPPPGPGLAPSGVCVPTGNTLQGFGLAAVDNLGSGNLGRVYMTNFTGGNPPHPMNYYDAPCPLTVQRCDSVTNLTAIRFGNDLRLNFTAPITNTGVITYTAYAAPLFTNVLPPNAPWVPVGTVVGAGGANLAITHVGPFAATPRMYRIVATCN